MIRLTIITIMLWVFMPLQAQLTPVYNVTSPDVASLGSFGNIPVGPFTGQPDISIPHFELKVGNYVFPLSIRYSLTSVKPDGQYGSTGMGWALDAGGFITRSANFIYDEKKSKDGTEFGYYCHHGKMSDINENSFKTKVANSLGNSAYDLCADEFHFSFCGYSGHFYMKPDGEWEVISDHDIKVEFNSNTGFINLNTLMQRIDIYQWSNRNNNDRFYNKFTLVTPDGCRYEFGGLYATEYSISFYNPNNSDFIPTTWMLSKIVTPDNRVINFNYEKDFIEGKPMLCDIRYAPQRIVEAGYGRDMKGYDGLVGFLIFPVHLESITTDSETVGLSYKKDGGYNSMFNLLQALWIGTKNTRVSPYDFGSYSPDDQYNAFFNVSPTLTDNQKRNAIRSRFSKYLLESITLTHEYDGTSMYVDFAYNNDNRKTLSSLTVCGYGHGGKYNEKKYAFEYDEEKMPNYFIVAGTDSWGYYNGSQISLSSAPTYSLTSASLKYTKAGTLKKIIYPTGGITEFEYELNSYAKTVGLDRTTLENGAGFAGGLRVKEIKTFDSSDNLVNRRKFSYTTTRSGTKSSGIIYIKPRFVITHEINSGNSAFNVIIYSKGGFWPSSSHDTSPIVGYSTVFEELFDSQGELVGYKRYDYSNYDNDIYGNTHMDENRICFTASGNGGYAKYTSNSLQRGKLLSEKFYSETGNLLKTENHRYTKVNEGSMYYASQHILTLTVGGGDFVPLGWFNKIYTYSYLANTSRDTTYSQQGNSYWHTSKTVAYKSNKLPQNISETNSTGGSITTTFKYPEDFTSYNWLVEKHATSTVIEKRISCSGQSMTEKYEYSQTTTGIPYLSAIKTDYGSGEREVYHVNLTDSYGNPVEIVSKGLTSVLYWGMWGQQLIGRLDNLSNTQAMSFGMPNAVTFSSTNTNWAENVEANFFRLPSYAHLHSFSYTGSGQVESALDPTGFTTYYKYDGLNRLREIYHFDNPTDEPIKRLIHVYDYHYHEENQD